MLISDVNRARVHRVLQTFSEVYAETGSITQSARHTVRYAGKKFVPLAGYVCFAATRSVFARRLRKSAASVPPTIPTIGFRVLGGIGDYIVMARFVRDLADRIGPAFFDVYSNKPASANWIFSRIAGFRGSFDEAVFNPEVAGYTVVAQISQVVVIDERSFQSARLAPHPRLRMIVDTIRRMRPSLELIISQQPRLDNLLAQKAVFANRTRQNYLHFMAGLDYGGDRLGVDIGAVTPLLHALNGKPYVTVHNGYDPNMVVSHARATKCYPHFGKAIESLRRIRGDIAFVQLGTHTSEPIPQADLNLIGRTSLAEAAGLIRGALLHLDNEGGLVHLAGCVGTRSCVVFGPTSSRYFGYAQNINIDPAFCGGCWWINETWMNHCLRGFATARCITEQSPFAIAEALARGLEPPSSETGSAPHRTAGPIKALAPSA